MGIQIKKLAIGLVFCLIAVLLISTVNVRAQKPSQKADINIEFEAKTDGRLHFLIEASGQPKTGQIETMGITGGSASVNITSRSLGQLKADASGSITITEPPEKVEFVLSMITLDTINNGIPGTGFEGLQSFEGKCLSDILPPSQLQRPGTLVEELPPGLADLKIEELRVTEFEWDKPRLEAGLTITLSGTIFENEELREELPISINASLSMSKTSMGLEADFSSTSTKFDLNVSSTISDTTQTITLTLEGYTELPRTDDAIQWNLEIPETQSILGPDYYDKLANQLRQNDITLTLKVPSDTKVSGQLPSGAQQEGNAYTWTGDGAANALASMATGQTEGQISYVYGAPPSELPWTWIGLGITIIIMIGIGLAVRKR